MTGDDVSERPPRAVDPRVADGAVALALLGLMLLTMGQEDPRPGQRPDDVLSAALAVAMTIPYAAHRRAPMAALTAGLAAVLVYAALHYPAYPGINAFVLLLGVALHSDRRRGLVAFAATFAVMMAALALQPPDITNSSDWISTASVTVVAYLLGENWRLRRARWAALRQRNDLLERERALLERERDERARQAVTSERLRIARELHDAVAHAMSVIAVQAGMGHYVIDTQPAEAKKALAAIETTTRTALVELRRMLGVLRHEDEAAAVLRPAHGLDDVPALVAAAVDGGVRATLEIRGARRELPVGVDLSVYRIVQEALTNAMKHGGSSARVVVEFADGNLQVEVTDDGAGAHASAVASPGDGQGLIGMRERVAVLGGDLITGPLPDGGFRVLARVPLLGGAR